MSTLPKSQSFETAFCIVSNQHLNGILRNTQDWYNKWRGHSERDQLPPIRDETATFPIKFCKDQVACDSDFAGICFRTGM